MGTKEGCNEGDCGACSVVVTDERGACALNACILLLPQLDGRAVRTVEGLTGPNGEPHPVQAAMVEHHGSQCGFCTPGFVVTMAAAHANGRRDHDDQLAGCLCRCTGYAPILRAARAVEDAPVPPWMREDPDLLSALGAPSRGAAEHGAPRAAAGGGSEGPGFDDADDGGSEPRPRAVPEGAAPRDRISAEGGPAGAVASAEAAAPGHAAVAADWGRRDPVAGTGASDAGDRGAPGTWVRPRSARTSSPPGTSPTPTPRWSRGPPMSGSGSPRACATSAPRPFSPAAPTCAASRWGPPRSASARWPRSRPCARRWRPSTRPSPRSCAATARPRCAAPPPWAATSPTARPSATARPP